MKLLILLLVLLTSYIFLSGCGSNITQSEAENLIKNRYPQKSEAYAISFVPGVDKMGVDSEKLSQFDQLKKKGLLDYQILGTHLNAPTLKDIEVKVTEKGQAYIQDDGSGTGTKIILLLDEDFDQITNITQKGDYVIIDYTTRFEPVEPFTEDEVTRIAPGCLEESGKYSASFIKKDNSWTPIPVP